MFIDFNISSKKISALRWVHSICLTFLFSVVAYPFRSSLAGTVSRPDILFSVDALSIEQSGISQWIEQKYPFLREWAEGLDKDFKFLSAMYKTVGLEEEGFSKFSLRLDGLDSLGEANDGDLVSLSPIFLEMNLLAEKPMDLNAFVKWLETLLASEIRTKKEVKEILLDTLVDDTKLRFMLDLQKLDSLTGGYSKDSVFLDNNFSVYIDIEENRTRMRGFLTHPIANQLMKLENFEEVSLISQLNPDRQVTFYLRVTEFITRNYFPRGQDGNPFAAVIEGVEEIALGASFGNDSVSLQCIIGCEENAITNALGSLLQGSLGMVQIGLMEGRETRALFDLLSLLKVEPKNKAVEVSLDVTSEKLGQLISWQLSSLAPEPPIQLCKSGPKALKGKDAPKVLLPTLSDKKFSLVSQKGKVVVLDFWASWSQPCRSALPILLEISSKYPKSQLCLMTINQKEDKEEILDFLNRYNLKSLPVAMDSDGESSKTYQVQGIPQTVIINQEGKVEKVWVRFSPFLENDLVSKINELLAR